MASTQEEPLPQTARRGACRQSATTAPAFRIRYGRTALPSPGLPRCSTGVISAVLLLFGLGLPAARRGPARRRRRRRVAPRLAVRDRRRKVDERLPLRHERAVQDRRRDQRSRPTTEALWPAPESPLFDAQAIAARRSRAKPLTAMELREAALGRSCCRGGPSASAGRSGAPLLKPPPGSLWTCPSLCTSRPPKLSGQRRSPWTCRKRPKRSASPR